MADENQNRERQAPGPDALDRELNSALAKYATVEPRLGLEDRVLANLRAEREHVAERSPSRWSIMPIALAIVAVIHRGCSATLAIGSAARFNDSESRFAECAVRTLARGKWPGKQR